VLDILATKYSKNIPDRN